MLSTRRITADCELNTILTTKFHGERTRYVEVGPDKVILPEEFEKHQEEILNFGVRDDDVYILSFPKTGTRWTQEMVWLLLNNLDFGKARDVDLMERAPLLEIDIVLDMFENNFQKISALKSPRCIGSHLPWLLLPKALRDGSKQPKMIVVLRGPEDMCLSYYHHLKVFSGYNGTFDEFCDLFLGGKVLYGPYWNHVLDFWNQRDRPNIMFLWYNEMKADLAGNIRKVAEFLGKVLSDEDVAAMCDHLTFDNLKTSKGFNMGIILNSIGGDTNPLIRTGTVGGHKDVMSAEKIAAFTVQRKLYLEGTGLNVD